MPSTNELFLPLLAFGGSQEYLKMDSHYLPYFIASGLYTLSESQQIVVRVKHRKFLLPPGFYLQMPGRVYA